VKLEKKLLEINWLILCPLNDAVSAAELQMKCMYDHKWSADLSVDFGRILSEGISFRKSVSEPENNLMVVCTDTEMWTRYFPCKVCSVTASCRQRRRPVTYDFYQSVQRWCTWGWHLWRRSSLFLISPVQNSSEERNHPALNDICL
jgi:hypothetical protein